MDFWYIWLVLFLCIWLPMITRKKRRKHRNIADRRRRSERRGKKMSIELIKKFIGKKCIFHGDGSDLSVPTGTLLSIEENWAEIEVDGGKTQLINLDYVSRIEEYPEKKKKK